MSFDRAGLRVLTRAECLQHLRTVSVCRIGLSHRALPMILPAHFRLDEDERIVVSTALATTLHRGTAGTVVAFEAEGPAGAVDPRWSVAGHGVATHRRAGSRPPAAERIDVVITTDELTGREVLATADPMAPLAGAAFARW